MWSIVDGRDLFGGGMFGGAGFLKVVDSLVSSSERSELLTSECSQPSSLEHSQLECWECSQPDHWEC